MAEREDERVSGGSRYTAGMANRRHHYERVFEEYLRDRRIPYVLVDEAKKALLPSGPVRRLARRDGGPEAENPARSLKSFDFVIYGESSNLLVEVKGRKIARARSRARRREAGSGSGVGAPRGSRGIARTRLESWVTEDDVRALQAWEGLFGEGFEAVFVFVYWCDEQPADGLYEEIIASRGRWYALRSILVREYARAMKTRSPRWGTVDVPREAFDRLSCPFAPPPRRDEADADLGPELPALEPLLRGMEAEA